MRFRCYRDGDDGRRPRFRRDSGVVRLCNTAVVAAARSQILTVVITITTTTTIHGGTRWCRTFVSDEKS